VNQSQRFSSTQFRPALQFFAPGEILAPEQTLSFLRRKVATQKLPLFEAFSAALYSQPAWSLERPANFTRFFVGSKIANRMIGQPHTHL
jgi:hypothetical protein